MVTSDTEGMGSGSGSLRFRTLLGPPLPLNLPRSGEIEGGAEGGKSSSEEGGYISPGGGDVIVGEDITVGGDINICLLRLRRPRKPRATGGLPGVV
jgi:hypothetical protein